MAPFAPSYLIVSHRLPQFAGHWGGVDDSHPPPNLLHDDGPDEVVTPAHRRRLIETQEVGIDLAGDGEVRADLHETRAARVEPIELLDDRMVDVAVVGAGRLGQCKIVFRNSIQIAIDEGRGQIDVIVADQHERVLVEIALRKESVQQDELGKRMLGAPYGY